MKPPAHSLPVVAYYQAYGEDPAYICAVIASYMEVGPTAEPKWLIAESQEWLSHPVVAWTDVPPCPPIQTKE